MKKDIQIKKRKRKKCQTTANFYSKGKINNTYEMARILIRLSRIKELFLLFILL